MLLFTKGDRLETKGLLKWEVLSWIDRLPVKYIESDSKAACRNEASGSSPLLTQYTCLLKKQVGTEVVACPGQRKAYLCPVHQTDRQIIVLWKHDLCTAAKGMETWYYEKQLSLSTSYFYKTKMTEKAQQNLLLPVISAVFTPLPNLSHPFYLETSQYTFQISSDFASFRSGYLKQKTQTWKNVIFSKASVRVVYSYPCFPEKMQLISRNWQTTDKLVCSDHGILILLKSNSLLIQLYWLYWIL